MIPHQKQTKWPFSEQSTMSAKQEHFSGQDPSETRLEEENSENARPDMYSGVEHSIRFWDFKLVVDSAY